MFRMARFRRIILFSVKLLVFYDELYSSNSDYEFLGFVDKADVE